MPNDSRAPLWAVNWALEKLFSGLAFSKYGRYWSQSVSVVWPCEVPPCRQSLPRSPSAPPSPQRKRAGRTACVLTGLCLGSLFGSSLGCSALLRAQVLKLLEMDLTGFCGGVLAAGLLSVFSSLIEDVGLDRLVTQTFSDFSPPCFNILLWYFKVFNKCWC